MLKSRVSSLQVAHHQKTTNPTRTRGSNRRSLWLFDSCCIWCMLAPSVASCLRTGAYMQHTGRYSSFSISIVWTGNVRSNCYLVLFSLLFWEKKKKETPDAAELSSGTWRERSRGHLWNLALFSSPKKAKSFQDFSSHRILRHMHEALNIDESKN